MASLNLDALTVKPYGVSVFTDRERGKEFTTLFYRKKDSRLETALVFITEVLAGISAAGFTLTGSIKVQLSPFGEAFRCHLEVSVKEAI